MPQKPPRPRQNASPDANKDSRQESSPLHPRNPHRQGNDFARLVQADRDLGRLVTRSPAGRASIDFGDPEAVFRLNRAILAAHYGIRDWTIPPGSLCPPVPGRADYIHYLADLLAGTEGPRRVQPQAIPRGPAVRLLDIGTGPGCIYPLLGQRSYGWSFVASDIQAASLDSARAILAANPEPGQAVELRLQADPGRIFQGIIRPGEQYAASLCNPPFHASAQEARLANRQRLDKMGLRPAAGRQLNFGGQGAELWCQGGETEFIRTMIRESAGFAGQVGWFTTLVAKSAHLKALEAELARVKATRVRVIPMAQGQKASRILAWSFAA